MKSRRPKGIVFRNGPRHAAAALVVAVFIFSGCTKNSSGAAGSGCISRFRPDLSQRILPQAQYDSVKTFFQSNGLSLDSLQPLGFAGSPLIGGGVYHQVPVRRLVNGLPVGNAYLRYDFGNGILAYRESRGYDLPLETSDTGTALSVLQVRDLFLAIKPDSLQLGYGFAAVPRHPTHWADSCLYAMLQYSDNSFYDLSAGHLLIRTWAIQRYPDAGPLAVVVDQTGKVYPTIFFF